MLPETSTYSLTRILGTQLLNICKAVESVEAGQLPFVKTFNALFSQPVV